jgi:gamma-glutamyl phosphate reductase
MAAETDVAWNAALDEIARHSGAFAAVNALLVRAAKAEAALVALIARLDAGGTPADVLADLATLLDETREIVPRAGEPPC